ncbi:uncharacterized protein LOC132281507 [Cornus florida]|uniref:uncharacterized protein LOC132281507 n=1 Tax=Cornus florida TaxID=4283 RepID=UPI002899EFED|nr:uncharacterized protein LOC132281507 [Cornus florida]
MEFQHLGHEMSEIEHPLHPRHRLSRCHVNDYSYDRRCDACGRWPEGFCFRCSKCKFTLDNECYRLTPTKSLDGDEHRIPHLHYSHSMILCDVIDNNFSRSCYACGLPIDENSVYVCLECKCVLHKSCGELQPENSHPFHQHPLRLIKGEDDFGNSQQRKGSRRPKEYYFKCHACGYKGGYYFSCSECKFELDLVCTSSLTPTTKNNHELGGHDQDLGHPHPLMLCDSTFDNFVRSCSACTLPFDQGSVIYVCLECKILLHKLCIGRLKPKIKHPFHPQHSLTLVSRHHHQSTVCKACGGTYFGCTYDCSIDGCDFTMHAKCASLVPTIWSELHDHPLAFFNKSESHYLDCRACTEYIYKDAAFFSCVDCKFFLHVHCNPTLPKTIKHECHIHPLTLTDSLVKYHPDDGEDAELYCDICEGRRYLLDSTYFCDDCKFVAHFDCVHHEVVRLQEEERTLACKNPVDAKMYTPIEVIEEKSTDAVASNVSDIKGTEQETTSSSSSEKGGVYSVSPELEEEIKMLWEEVNPRLTKLEALNTNLEALESMRATRYALQNSGDKLDQSTEGKE